MTELITEIIGAIGATLTTISFIPQATKVYRSKDTVAISMKMYLLFVIGVAFWLVYGILLGKFPVIIANLITLFLAGYILLQKIKNIKNPNFKD